MAPRDPYKIHRQEHLGDFLDGLAGQNLLSWNWGYEKRRALFTITEPGASRVTYQIMEAEGVAMRIAARETIIWIPVPHPGNSDLYRETRAKIAELKAASSQ